MGAVANTEIILSALPELLVPAGGGVGEVFVFPVVSVGLVGVVGTVGVVEFPVGVVGVVGVVGFSVGVEGVLGVVVFGGVVVPGVVVLVTIWVKFAVHDLSLVIFTCPLTQSPLQLPNCQPVVGIAESVTGVSCA